MVEINNRRRRGMPSPGNVRAVLKSVEDNFPRFNADPEMRAMAVLGLAQCVGAVVAWVLHHEGQERAERALRVIYAMGYDTALKGDAMLRQREGRIDIDRLAEEQ